MDWVSVAARLLLVTVFLVAGVMKLRDREGTRASLSEFRVPVAWLGGVAWMLPIGEILTAAGLLVTVTARIAAAGATLLLVLFSGGIIAALRRGERPDCHCFGQVHSEPVGPWTLVRNVGLMVCSALIIVSDPVAIPEWFGDRSVAELTTLAFAATSTLALTVAAAEHSRAEALKRALGGLDAPLDPGDAAPPFLIRDLQGTQLGLADLGASAAGCLLAFVDTDCEPCRELMPQLARWQRQFDRRLPVHVVVSGGPEAGADIQSRADITRVLLDEDGSAQHAFGIRGTPSAVHLDQSGVLTRRVVAGPAAVEALFRVTLADFAPAPAAATGATVV